MKIGIISDIHANETALTAVLDDMQTVDTLISLGDVVGYGPRPRETTTTIRERTSVSLCGNHEHYLTDPTRCRGHPGAHKGITHALDELSDEQQEWLTTRPLTDTINTTLKIVHGHPNPDRPYKYIRENNMQNVIPYMENMDCNILAAGHSHIQFKQEVTNDKGELIGTVVNPGSVGQPRDKNPKAGYAIIETDPADVTLHRVEYDYETTIDRIRETGLPPQSGKRLRAGQLQRR